MGGDGCGDRARRWHSGRNPPLSVAVTLVDLEPAGNLTQELMPSRGRAKAISAALDSINQRYGNNTLYFGAMQEALEQDAAPMRIPFQTIPEAGLDEDVGARRPADTAEELWLQRERQFKVMAELAHRQAQAAGKGRPIRKPAAYGTGGWVRREAGGEGGGEVDQTPRSGSLF